MLALLVLALLVLALLLLALLLTINLLASIFYSTFVVNDKPYNMRLSYITPLTRAYFKTLLTN